MILIRHIKDVVAEVLSAAKHELLAQLRAPGVQEELDILRLNYRERGEQLDKERAELQFIRNRNEEEIRGWREAKEAMANGWGMCAEELEAWKLRFAQLTDCGASKGCGAKCLVCAKRSNDGWMARAKDAEALQAETAMLLAEMTKDRDSWKREFDMYTKAWLRELGGKLFNNHHPIDAFVMTTEWMRNRSDRFEVTHALAKKALAHMQAIPADLGGALAALKEATR